MNVKITKELLDDMYARTFDIERFKKVDPCGLVYELIENSRDNSSTTQERQLDIELGALFVAIITWGNRKAIRTAARHMLADEMNWHPARFVREGRYVDSYSTAKNNCVYRTLNVPTFKAICSNIREGMGEARTLEERFEGMTIEQCIATLAQWLSPARLGTANKSACKRICMFLRWMVRQTTPDLGLWRTKSQSDLYAVMDVHVCQLTASILTTKQANWKACCELTSIFRNWCPDDPLKYDIALMTLADRGVEEGVSTASTSNSDPEAERVE